MECFWNVAIVALVIANFIRGAYAMFLIGSEFDNRRKVERFASVIDYTTLAILLATLLR